MCVIAVKPASKPMFSDELIREMFDENPDGAGLMYPDDKGVRIRKGFMTVDEVLNFVHSRDWDGIPVVMHFRIGTAAKRQIQLSPVCRWKTEYYQRSL